MFSVLVAPDSFKGTLSAGEVCNIIEQAFKNEIENVKVTKLPAADGGEGLCACLKEIIGGEIIRKEVSGVFGEKMIAEYLMLADGTAVVESAVCAGLPLAGNAKNPEKATTLGVGELIADAAFNGARHVLLGLGGSATNDCGAGMASALGWRFLDERGKGFVPLGGTLGRITKIIPPSEPVRIPITAACDVDNPLYGESGAAYVFAVQKGADPDMVKRLDGGLRHIAEIIRRDLGIDVAAIKGGGAAGGAGAGAVAFLGAKLRRGIDIILDAARFDEKAAEADLIITGEGRLDSQSVNGKVVSGVALRCSRLGKRVITICGSEGNGACEIMKLGVEKLYFACEKEKPFDEIIKTCREDLYNAAIRAAKDIQA